MILVTLSFVLSSCEYFLPDFKEERIDRRETNVRTLDSIDHLTSTTNDLVRSGENVAQSQRDLTDALRKTFQSQSDLTETLGSDFKSEEQLRIKLAKNQGLRVTALDSLISALKANADALGQKVTPAKTRKEKILQLAGKWIEESGNKEKLRPQETCLLKAAAAGGVADLGLPEALRSKTYTSCPTGKVRASVLEWMLTDPQAEENLDPRGLFVFGATIEGRLDLAHVVLQSPLWLYYCQILEGLDVHSAKTETVDLQGSSLGPLDAHRIRIDHGDLLLTDASVNGGVDLSDAQIDGRINCDGAIFSAGGNPYSFNAEQASIGGHLEFGTLSKTRFLTGGGTENKATENRSFRSLGAIDLEAATIGGNLIFDDATLASPESARSSEKKDITHSEGEAGLHARFTNVGGTLVWKLAATQQPTVVLDLSHARVRALADAQNSWPLKRNLHIVGFTYDSIVDDDPYHKQTRLDWLQRESPSDSLIAQPYSQLASVLKAAGRDSEASDVLYAMREAHLNSYKPSWFRLFGLAEAAESLDAAQNIEPTESQQSSFLRWLAGEVLAQTVGFGYRPDKIVYSYIVFIAFGGLVSWFCRDCFVKKPGYDDDFKPLLYSFDLIIPPLKFGQVENFRPVSSTEDHYSPKARVLGIYITFHKFLGWIFPLLVAVGASISAYLIS